MPTNSRALAAALLSLAVSGCVASQPLPPPALDHPANPDASGVAQADLVQAGLLKNPVLSGDLKFFDAGTKIELSLVGDFLDVLYIAMKKSIAETALQGAKLRVSLAVLDVASEVGTTFYALQ